MENTQHKKLSNAKGASRDLLQVYMQTKQRLRQNHDPNYDPQRERFKPKSKLLQPNVHQESTNESMKQQVNNALSPMKNSITKHSNLKDDQYLPPEWIDMAGDIDDYIMTIENYFEELRPLRTQRFGNVMFDDKGAQRLDEHISQLVHKITALIRKCESKLQEMQIGEENTSQVKIQIIKNVQQRYFVKLQQFSATLKTVEKAYIDKMTDLYGKDFLNYENNNQQQQLQQEQINPGVKYSNQQVQKIIDQMTGLADIYKQMSALVIEQGTVMDRIDENIFETRYQVREGKEQLQQTLDKETSPKASACIVCLVQSIMICVGIIAFQHM